MEADLALAKQLMAKVDAEKGIEGNPVEAHAAAAEPQDAPAAGALSSNPCETEWRFDSVVYFSPALAWSQCCPIKPSTWRLRSASFHGILQLW